MYIKIYFNEKPLFLCNEVNKEIDSYAHHDDAVFIDDFSTPSVNSMIHEMRQEKVHAGVFVHQDIQALKKTFWKKFLVLQAAGGLVQNEKGEMLFMLRRGKWDLPKGKLDKGETLEQCALREVEEETGLTDVRLEQQLLTTYHTYDESGKHFLKETHWYRMRVFGAQTMQPQAEEQITELKWVSSRELNTVTGNTFPSILDVLRSAGLPL